MNDALLLMALQVIGGALVVIALSLSGWALKQVYVLRADFERHRGCVDASLENLKNRADTEAIETTRRFGELRDGLKAIDDKVTKLVEKLLRE